MILEIERAWGKDPGWFETLDRGRQIDLLAWNRHRNAAAEEE